MSPARPRFYYYADGAKVPLEIDDAPLADPGREAAAPNDMPRE